MDPRFLHPTKKTAISTSPETQEILGLPKNATPSEPGAKQTAAPAAKSFEDDSSNLFDWSHEAEFCSDIEPWPRAVVALPKPTDVPVADELPSSLPGFVSCFGEIPEGSDTKDPVSAVEDTLASIRPESRVSNKELDSHIQKAEIEVLKEEHKEQIESLKKQHAQEVRRLKKIVEKIATIVGCDEDDHEEMFDRVRGWDASCVPFTLSRAILAAQPHPLW